MGGNHSNGERDGGGWGGGMEFLKRKTARCFRDLMSYPQLTSATVQSPTGELYQRIIAAGLLHALHAMALTYMRISKQQPQAGWL